jgi:predicted aldo/keto reductase-like oxidoreductase
MGLRWIWNHPEVTVVLSGMNEEIHIEENLRIAAEAYPNSLTEAELQLVKRVTSKYRELMKVGCTGCRYCMPCPAGVNIPLCFEEYNNLYLVDDPEGERFIMRYGGRCCHYPRVCIPVCPVRTVP